MDKRIATICGHEYVWSFNVPRAYCQDCVREMGRRIDQENAERAARRAAAAGRAKWYYIAAATRLAVYERDGWVCQLCLEPVDPDLMSLNPHDDWAPSLDHIVCRSWTDEPDHSPRNLRLAHRWCNSVRGDESRWTVDDLRPAAAVSA